MKLRKSNFDKQREKHSKRFFSLSRICMLLLFVLVVFYYIDASYLIPSYSKVKRSIDDLPNNQFIQQRIATKDKIEDPKYTHQQEDYLNPQPPETTSQQSIDITETNKEIPSQSLPPNDYSDTAEVEDEYLSKCPEKFPKTVPKINEFDIICSNLDEFEIENCTAQTCQECVPPTSKHMKTENEEVCSIRMFDIIACSNFPKIYQKERQRPGKRNSKNKLHKDARTSTQ